jgi:hypothetical protein
MIMQNRASHSLYRAPDFGRPIANAESSMGLDRYLIDCVGNRYIMMRLILSGEGFLLRSRFAVAAILLVVVVASVSAWTYVQVSYNSGYKKGYGDASNFGAGQVDFNSTELQNFDKIKSSLNVTNTDPAFAGNGTLQWISMRNSTNAPWDPYQKSMEYLCFWSGQGAKGEWEAVVSIYNSPDNMTDYVVEVARFTWHSLEVSLDRNVMVTFPEVTSDTTSLGYATFHVEV